MPTASATGLRGKGRWLTILLGFVVAGGWTIQAATLPAQELPPPVAAWEFAPDALRDGELRPVEGTWSLRPNQELAWLERPAAVELPGSAALSAGPVTPEHEALPQEAFSVECVVRVDQPAAWGAFLGAIQDNGDYERGFLLGYRDDRFCLAVSSESRQRLTYLTSAMPYVPGHWYHVAGTYDGNTMRLYVDGELQAESNDQSGPLAYPPSTWLDVAAYHDDNEFYGMRGHMVSVALWHRPLDADQVRERFEWWADRVEGLRTVVDPTPGWPTYRHDVARSGRTRESLQLPLRSAWRWQSALPPAPAWPPPARQDFWHDKYDLPARVIFDRAFHVVSDGRLLWFGSSSDDTVRCLDIGSGQEQWHFTSEGPVRLAPTYSDGRLLVGSDDGHVYCLDSVSGELLWKTAGHDPDLRIPGNGRIISLWPVRSSLLVHEGIVRGAAGLFPLQGTFQFALDLESGRELARAPLPFSPQGYLSRQGSRIVIPQGRAPATAVETEDPAGPKVQRLAELHLPDGFTLCRIAAGDVVYAGGDGAVAAFDPTAPSEPLWSAEVPGKAYGLAVAGGHLLVSTDTGAVIAFRSADLAVTDRPPAPIRSGPQLRASAETHATVRRLFAETGVRRGYALVWRSAELAAEVAKQSDLRVILAEPDGGRAREAREAVHATGLAGRMVVHHVGADGALPYGDWIFNLVYAETPGGLHEHALFEEFARVLHPARGALVSSGSTDAADAWAESGLRVRSANELLVLEHVPREGLGQWTHMYAEPGNSVCSGDEHVSGPMVLQWFGRPGPQPMVDRHHRAVPPLCADGRIFVPGNGHLFGVDAYNGTVLWHRTLPGFLRVAAMRDSGNMAAGKNGLYIVREDHCLVLDPSTGSTRMRLETSPGRGWGWIAVHDGLLYGSETMPGASRTGHSRRQIDDTYWDHRPIVTSTSVFARDVSTGRQRWQYRSRAGAILNPTLTIGGERLYFLESHEETTREAPAGRSRLDALLRGGADLVALDVKSGQELWREAVELSRLEHHVYLSYADDVLVVVGSRNQQQGDRLTVWYDVHGFSAADGSPLWNRTQDQGQGINGDHGEQDHHPVIVGSVVYVEPHAYDLITGESRPDWIFARGGHGCGTISASASAAFFRATNPTMFDLENGTSQRITQVSRPGCWINILPAEGLLLIPEASSGCTCNFPVQASLAFRPLGRRVGGESETREP